MPPALAYTMISRTESVEDLYITGDFDHKKIKCDPKALQESERLNNISLTNLPTRKIRMQELFSFGFVNIRSLPKNFEHLQLDHVMLEEDIIFVTETWIHPKSRKTFELK